MKKTILIALLLLATIAMPAQKKNKQPRRPKVGVVLGGGGAKGASHIGVLKYMEEIGIPVDYVAGTSMGAIIGGFYAMGYSPDELTDLIGGINWSEYIGNKIDRTMMSEEAKQRASKFMFNLPFGFENLLNKETKSSIISQLPSAYVNNSSLVNLFNDLCVGYQEEMDFNDMPIPFACVATDVVTGEEVVLRHGRAPTAMRASMAIPGVFSPVAMDNMLLVDGGLVNNFPADVLREMGADIIIGVEVTTEAKVTKKDIQSLPQLLGRLLVNVTGGKRKENRELCDIHIIPNVNGYGMLSFSHNAIDTLVNRGYKKAAEYHDQMVAIKQRIETAAGGPVSKKLQAPKSRNLKVDPVLLTSINITGVSQKQSEWLLRKGGLETGRSYSEADIEKTMSLYRGTGCFDEITYTIMENDSIDHGHDKLSDTYALNINLKPAYPNLIGIGLRYDTEEGAAILVHFGLNEKRFGGSKFNADFKLSYNPRINLTYTYSRASLANFNLAYDYRDEHFTYNLKFNQKTNLHFIQHKASAYISQFHMLNFSTTFGVSLVSTRFDRSSMEESIVDSVVFMANKQIMPFIDLKYDNLDDAYFAKRGIFATLSGHLYFEDNPIDVRKPPVDICYSFQAYLTPNNGKFTFIPQLYGRNLLGHSLSYNLWSHVGSEIPGRHFETQMPFIGLTETPDVSDHCSILRCDLRYHIFGKHYLTAMYNALMSFTIEEDFFGVDVFHGAGLKYSYNSFLGPISLTGQWCYPGQSYFSVYFSFGYNF